MSKMAKKKLQKFSKYTKYSIAIIILFSIIVLGLTSVHHVSGDGCWHASIARFIASEFKIPAHEQLGRDLPFWSPPLYHFLSAAVYLVFSPIGKDFANFAVKFISPVFGILSLMFSFLTIKKLVNPRIAFYSTIFLAFVPIFLDYSIFSYVEMTLTFFAVLSVYFIVNDKVFLSGTAAGLAMLAKYNGAFIIPVLIFICYKKSSGKKTFYKNAIIIGLASLIIASPWLLRNWILLGNPIWPFLNFIFHGVEARSYGNLQIENLVHPNIILFTYLGIFGVPDGNYRAFSFFDVPYFEFILVIWLIGTLIFIAPFFVGLFAKITGGKDKKYVKRILIIWILSYLAVFLLYVVNVSWAVSRMILPAFPALAVFWAFGFEKLINSRFRKIVIVMVVLVISGLIFSEVFKISASANAWGFYKEDFEWVKSSTKQDAVFIVVSQCIPYNIERNSLFFSDENINKADYIWVNQNFKLDAYSILNEHALNTIRSRNYKVAYSNKKTGTAIYQIR